jgi:PAS domain S-box-containing protein
MIREKIIVVEDERILAEDIKDMLMGFGYRVPAVVSTGQEAIKAVHKLQPDLVLMDVMLRESSFDGIETAMRLKDRYNVPVVYLTAYADDETLDRAKTTEPFGYIIKPFEERELRTTVEMALYKHRMEAKIRDSEALHRSLINDVLDNSRTGIFILDASFKIVWANKAVEGFFGLKRNDLIGLDKRICIRKKIAPLLDRPEVFADRILASYANATFTESDECHVLPTANCQERWLEHWSQPIQGGLFQYGRIEHYYDMTDRKHAERAVLESEQKFRDFFERSPDPIYVIEKSGKIVDVNFPGCRLVGHQKPQLTGKLFSGLVPVEQRTEFEQNLARLLTQNHDSLECVISHNSGNYIQAEIRLSQYSHKGVAVRLLHIRDITDRKQLEEQLLQSQKMDAIGRLAGGIAHDFNNLLMGILGYCECLLTDLPAKSEYRDDIIEIEKAGEKAAALTRQLLAFSRKQAIAPTALNLNEIVSDMEKLLMRVIGPDIQLQTNKQTDLWAARCDRAQIEQVIMNLSVNAKEAMPEGGGLAIKTANITIAEDDARVHQGMSPGYYVCITIQDTGVGMDSKTQSHAFEPFFTTKEVGKGTGLGLATVYGIVIQNDGHIFVSSRKNKGTTFAIYFPRVSQRHTTRTQSLLGQSDHHGSGTILLVEDEEVVRTFTKTLLKKRGYTILEACEPEEAIRISASFEGKLDLLITDVIMPKMNGQKLAVQLRESRPELKVIFMSGYTDDSVDPDLFLDGVACFLQKPFKTDELIDAIAQIQSSLSETGQPPS